MATQIHGKAKEIAFPITDDMADEIAAAYTISNIAAKARSSPTAQRNTSTTSASPQLNDDEIDKQP